MRSYDHKKIEKKWQAVWSKKKLYKTAESGSSEKSYVLDMFPYPSGEGLHAGHVRIYTASDVYSRYKRMKGFRVLHPTGWDAFGLPAEQFAINNKVHPRDAVDKNVANFRRQMKMVGLSYDWEREIDTTDPNFYKWTQWIFLKLLEKGLAYESYEPINWCPSCQTGLANEDLEGDKCERCGSVVEKKPMRQWVLRITKYAERLVNDLETLKDWPESFKEAQRNWIGRSEGAEIEFSLSNISGQLDGKHSIKVFTTRPDTLFGATFLAISPEVAKKWIGVGWKTSEKVKNFVDSELKRRGENKYQGEKEKRGVDSGILATNPANNEKIPVWVVNYVLGDVGTGAIMAVPAHDDRDFEFAKKFGLPIKIVIEPITGKQKENEEKRQSIVALVRNPRDKKILSLNWGKSLGGRLFIGGGIENNESPEETARREILEETGYRNVRLLSISEKIHHHYFAHSKGVAREIEVTGLYFELINDEKIETKHDNTEKGNFKVEWVKEDEASREVFDPLHSYVFSKFISGKCYVESGILTGSGKFNGLDSEIAKKKINDFVGGKWTTTYKLRDWVFSRQRYWGEPIPVIHCEKDGVVPVLEKDLPVKLPKVKSYAPTGTGESPLATIDSWVKIKCPKCGGLAKRETNTMPQWAGSSWYYLRFIDPKNKKVLIDKEKEKKWMPVDVYVGGAEHATRHLIYARFWHKFLLDLGIVSTKEPFTRLESVGLVLGEGGTKMSKRLGNIINPDDVVKLYGADTLRLYEMFMGPFSQEIAWDTKSIIGLRRFIERVWKLKDRVKEKVENKNLSQIINQTIKKVGEDIEAFKFNTAISQLMVCLNSFEKEESISRKEFESFLTLLAPMAPFVAEELWTELGNKESIHLSKWPTYDEKRLISDKVIIVVQVNGKVRGQFEATRGITDLDAQREALSMESVAKWLSGKKPKKTFYIENRLLNIVI